MAATNKQLKRKLWSHHKPPQGKLGEGKAVYYLAFFVPIVASGWSVRVGVISNCLKGKMQKETCSLPGFLWGEYIQYMNNEALLEAFYSSGVFNFSK